MKRALAPLACLGLALFACEPKETVTPDATQTEAEATADGENNEAAEMSEEEARAAKLAQRFADLEEAKKAEAARWTDEMKAAAKALVEADYKNASEAIAAILAGTHRNPENVARDAYRHPAETLAFFKLEQNMTVVEMGPGGGWYTEILAPFLAKKGKLMVNNGDPNGPEDEGGTFYARRFQYFVESNPDLYGKIEQHRPGEGGALNLGPAESADAVLVIRGLHGITRRGELDATLDVVHSTLKKGGTFGVIQHRAADDADVTKTAEDGYIPQPWLVAAIEAKGFKLEEASEINANANDTHDHPEGVWTLPPTLALGDQDADKYKAIGESDRMTLRFTKK